MFKSFKSLLLCPGLEGCSIGPIQARENPSLPLFNESLNVSTGARQQPIRFPPGIFCGWLSRHRNAHQPYAIHMQSICSINGYQMDIKWISNGYQMDIKWISNGYQWYLPRPRSLRRDLCLAAGTLLADAWQSIPDTSSTAMLKTSENHQKSTDCPWWIGMLCDVRTLCSMCAYCAFGFLSEARQFGMPRCHPSFGKHWLAAKVQGFRQADGNAMGLA